MILCHWSGKTILKNIPSGQRLTKHSQGLEGLPKWLIFVRRYLIFSCCSQVTVWLQGTMFTLTRKLYEEYWKRNQVSDFTFVAPLTRLKQKSFKTFNATLSLYITLTHSLMWRERERKGEYFLLSGGIKIKRNRVWKGYREQTESFLLNGLIGNK